MSLTSGYRLDRSSVLLAYAASFVEAGYFCVLSVAYVLGSLWLCVALAAALSSKAPAVATSLRTWVDAVPWWGGAAALVTYPALVLAYWLPGTRAQTPRPGIVSVVLKAGLFVLISAAYLVGMGLLCLAVAPQAPAAGADGASLAGLLDQTPVWGYAAAFAAYLLLITVYYAPGEQRADHVELLAFTIFLAVAAGAGFWALIGRWAVHQPFWQDVPKWLRDVVAWIT